MFNKLKNSFYQFKNKTHYQLCSKYDKFMFVLKGNDDYFTEIEESEIIKLEKLKRNICSSKISNFMKTLISKKQNKKKLVVNENTISKKILTVLKNKKKRKKRRRGNRKNKRKY